MSIFLNEYQSAIRRVELGVGRVRPGGRAIITKNPKPVKWVDATEEQRNTLRWIKWSDDKQEHAWALIPPSEEDLKEYELNKIWHYTTVYNTLLKDYGEVHAYKYAKSFEEDFKKYHIQVKGWDFPSCYLENKKQCAGQCTMSCPFFDGKCLYEDKRK